MWIPAERNITTTDPAVVVIDPIIQVGKVLQALRLAIIEEGATQDHPNGIDGHDLQMQIDDL